MLSLLISDHIIFPENEFKKDNWSNFDQLTYGQRQTSFFSFDYYLGWWDWL